MTRNNRILVSVALLVIMCLSVLTTLSACGLSDVVSGIHKHSNGVYYTVYPLRRHATVHGFDRTDDVEQIYTIPSYVKYLGLRYSVTRFEGPNDLEDISSDWYRIVHGGNAKGLVVPKTVEYFSIGASYDDLKNMTFITVDENNTHYKSVDGVLYSADGSNMIFYPPAKVTNSFTLPKEVTRITSPFFNQNESVQEFYVESGSQTYCAINGAIYTIDGSKLLYYPCGKHVDTFVIPKQMTEFDYDFFRHNEDIKYFEAEDGNRLYSAINGDVYSADGGILLFRKSHGNGALELPSSIRIVGEGTLDGVEYLYVPVGLEKIVFKTSFRYETNVNNPLGDIEYVFFESKILPHYARYVKFSSAYLGVTAEQFWLAVGGDFGELKPMEM
ncbi:MAG: hypothetical protein J1G02_03165 [Clostridiales bacterium]|nr:hypothetical protein [Clostridiales bacterium]